MNKLDRDYQELLRDILADGIEKEDRTGTGTISVFGRQIRHNMKKGFPLLTTKKMAVKTMMTELKWFLKGDTNIKYLVDNGCNIWNGDAYKAYKSRTDNHMTMDEFIELIKTDEQFAAKWGELGPIYGHQWRHWVVKNEIESGGEYVWVDQIEWLVDQLKNNPDSRRLMVNAWNVSDLPDMALPPCHYGFQVYTRPTTREEKIVNPGKYRAISLMWNQRSVDTPLGLPFNIASYATLLMLLAEECDMIPDELIGNLGDVHVYKNQLEGVNEQMERTPFDLPTLKLSNVNIIAGEFDWELENYQCHPSVKFPLSN